jgi:hypothetical protein
MATILMGWELGEGLGHVHNLIDVGRALAVEGHQPIFVLCNVVEPWPLLQHDGFAVLQAPYWDRGVRSGDPPFVAASLADVLAVRGWRTPETLQPLVAAWQRLLEYMQPRLIVTDYAPTLCLAAYQSTPVVQMGSWFALPPVDAPAFPLLLPGQTPVVAQQALLEVVQQVQQRRRCAAPPTLTAILAGDRFPMIVPELDPYQEQRREAVWDPLAPLPPPAAGLPQSGFFAYLTAENPQVEGVLTQLALTGRRGTVYLRSAPAELKERLRLQGLMVVDQPASLPEMLAQSAIIVHHGGSATACAALAAGRPQLLLPQHLEQATNAQALVRLGVAHFLTRSAAPEAAGRCLRQLLEDHRYGEAAVACARRIAQRRGRPALPAILECCRRHLS